MKVSLTILLSSKKILWKLLSYIEILYFNETGLFINYLNYLSNFRLNYLSLENFIVIEYK